MKPCHTPYCENTCGDRSEIGLCKACYSYMYFWHKKTPKQLVKRATQLQVFEARMDLLLPSNTAIHGRKRVTRKTLDIMPGELKKAKKRKIKAA